jgi:excisionase family DNA binding protein
MDIEQPAKPENEETTQPLPDAPSPRAASLRKELFGSALTLDEAAYILSLDRTTVAKYLRERTLFGFQIGREWLIPEEELRAYVSRVYRTAAQGGPEADSEEREAHPAGDEGASRPVDVIQRNLFGKLFPRGKDREKSGSANRFDKFTDRARHILVLAQEEAVQFHHNYIGTEHLLLGLIREEEGVAAKVLSSLAIEPLRVRSAVERIVGRGEGPVGGEVGLTPRSKKAIELAIDEARQLNHSYIGTEHLLLGLIREGNGIAAGVLESLGVTLEGVRAQIIQVLTQSGGPVPTSPPEVPTEAAALVSEGAPGHPCPRCSAVSPAYFRYCFNCGERLGEVA